MQKQQQQQQTQRLQQPEKWKLLFLKRTISFYQTDKLYVVKFA